MRNQFFLRVDAKRTPLVAKTVEILKREFAERSILEMVDTHTRKNDCDLILDICPDIGTEGFHIKQAEDGKGRLITGNDERGLLYGVGKYLRGCSFGDTAEEFRHSSWEGVSVPKRPVRGIYFATHFHNFYHDAPLEKIKRYVEELALWGCNALSVWFDMHHFNGIADPAAQVMIRRLRAILRTANAVGIRGGLTALANEAYANSPAELRADWTAGHDGYFTPPGGHYHVEICPNKPGGMERILKDRRDMLEAFADLDIEYIWNWPYDQGGCTCSACAPWGANGFLKIATLYAEVVRGVMPKAKLILSTWYFDHFINGEWEGLDKTLASNRPEFADFLMVDDNGDKFPEYPLKHGAPGGLPMLNFPEISMYNMYPWGGYGANPLPRHLQHIWEAAGQVLSGGFPYSEGIFEDVNKAINLQHYWSDQDAIDTVREYAAAVTSPALADELVPAILQMEDHHQHCPAKMPEEEELRNKLYPDGHGEPDCVTIKADKVAGAEKCQSIMRAIEQRLPTAARTAWRWRLLRLRSDIDAEIARGKGRMTSPMDGMLEELVTIYHAQAAEGAVCPQSRRSLLRLKGL